MIVTIGDKEKTALDVNIISRRILINRQLGIIVVASSTEQMTKERTDVQSFMGMVISSNTTQSEPGDYKQFNLGHFELFARQITLQNL